MIEWHNQVIVRAALKGLDGGFVVSSTNAGNDRGCFDVLSQRWDVSKLFPIEHRRCFHKSHVRLVLLHSIEKFRLALGRYDLDH